MTFDEWYEKDGKFDDHCGADKKELAKLAWQARGELDAVRIKELEAKLDKVKRTVFLGKSLSEANERYLDELANECSDPNL